MLNRVSDPGVPGVIEALRDATRARHASLVASSAMVRLFDSAYTLSEYRAHLGRLLGLFEPLERAVADATDPADRGCTIQRSSALREDLRIMGATARGIDALERCHQLPHIASAGLAGYTYVILGSMWVEKSSSGDCAPFLAQKRVFSSTVMGTADLSHCGRRFARSWRKMGKAMSR
jgi:heme oxygenase